MRHSWSFATRWPLCLGSITLALLASCITPTDKTTQLERVAKDWCLSIRASQILPVYPLTQDLWPGDVFLTMTEVGEEVKQFEAKGFLPLDFHLVRLDATSALQKFYATHLGDGSSFPNPNAQWQDLPGCAFPTYSFEISRAGGLSLAIPVQSVPVGFNYLRSAAATGTVTLRNAETAGLDIASLRPLLETWEKANRELLDAYAPQTESAGTPRVYVRVVSRVYRVGSVAVQLNDASATGAAAAAGVDLPDPQPGTPSATKSAAEQYSELADKLSAALNGKLGGKARVVSVSRRSVTLEEEFATPMVVGYLAYDCAILPGGVLSPPVASYQRLTGNEATPTGVFNSSALVQAWYTQDESTRVPQIKQWIKDNKPVDDAGSPPAGEVEFLSLPKWDAARQRMLRKLGVLRR